MCLMAKKNQNIKQKQYCDKFSKDLKNGPHQKKTLGASLVAQWLGVCLLVWGTRVRALVWGDPTCRGAARPVSHNY